VVEEMIKEARVRSMSPSVNHHPTPGIVAFSAPVFDYSENIALTITTQPARSIPIGTAPLQSHGR